MDKLEFLKERLRSIRAQAMDVADDEGYVVGVRVSCMVIATGVREIFRLLDTPEIEANHARSVEAGVAAKSPGV